MCLLLKLIREVKQILKWERMNLFAEKNLANQNLITAAKKIFLTN